jgi:hypothetical protein
MAVQRLFTAGLVRAKLTVSKPGDPDETDADRIADRVALHRGMPTDTACGACSSGKPCAECEENQRIRPKLLSARTSTVTTAVEAAASAVNAGGARPLPDSVRTSFESSIGADLGRVRLHTDAQAAASARALGARAYALGEHVVFGAGEYSPDTVSGQRLLSHELAHVLQHRRSPMSPSRVRRQEVPPAADPNAAAPPLPAGVMPGTGPIKRTPPAAGTETITFEGVLLSTDTDFVRWQLEQQVTSGGQANVGGFVDRLSKAPAEDEKNLAANKRLAEDTKKYPGDVSGAPLPQKTADEMEHRVQNKERTKQVAAGVKTVWDTIVAQNNDFIAQFESTGLGKLRQMLSESKGRVEAEANHYGVPKEVLRSTGTTRTTAFPAPKTAADVKNAGGGEKWDQESANRTEKEAAPARKRLVEAAVALQNKRAEVAKVKAAHPQTPPGQIAPTPNTPIDVLPLVKVEGEYRALRREKEAEFPILATYAQEGGDLNVIIRAGGALKNIVSTELIEKYNKILATESYIDEKKVTMWDLPTIVEGTRTVAKVDKDTMRWRVLQDKIGAVNREKKESTEIKEAIGGIAMILGLIAAVPSLGASGVAAGAVSTAIGAGMVVGDLQEYIMQSALSGTDFDRARAISQEEPSLFDIAEKIVMTIVDVHGAVKAFRGIVGLRRAALIGEAEAAKALRAEGNRIAAGLGDKMVKDVEALQRGGGAAAKGGRAAEIIDRGALEAGKLGEAVVHGVEQHEIIITKSGAFRCSKKCANLLWLYEDVLQQYPSLKPRLQNLIGMGEAGGKPLAAFTQRMDRLREVAAMNEEQLAKAVKSNPPGSVLGDHLRYEQYRRGGGLAPYEEFAAQSRGPAMKGQDVWGQLSEELQLPPATATPGKLTAVQRQQLLAEARTVDTAESVAGGYRGKFGAIHPDFPGGREWQVHHSIPQKFRATLTRAGVNVDSPSFLRGVRTTAGETSNAHQKITNAWEGWHREFKSTFGREPAAAEIIEQSKLIDWQFGGVYWEAEKAAGMVVPTRPPGP